MNPHLIQFFFAVVSNEDVEPPEDSLPDPQDTFAIVQSDPPCIDSAPTEHSEPQAEQAHGRQRATPSIEEFREFTVILFRRNCFTAETAKIPSLYGPELCLVNSFSPPIRCITAGFSSYFHSAP